MLLRERGLTPRQPGRNGVAALLGLLFLGLSSQHCGRFGYDLLPLGMRDDGGNAADAGATGIGDGGTSGQGGRASALGGNAGAAGAPNADNPPVLVAIQDQTVMVGSLLSIDANDETGGDVDGDGQPLTYACQLDFLEDGPDAPIPCTQHPSEAISFDTGTGSLSWVPQMVDLGSYAVSISASDGALEARIEFFIFVTPDQRPPDLTVGELVLVSRSWDGGEANADSKGHTVGISGDGRYVVFTSDASNLVENDTNGLEDTFYADLLLGIIRRVSVSSTGEQANGRSDEDGTGISDDGQTLVFMSEASNLVANDTNGASDIFVHRRLTGETTRVSVSSAGVQGNGGCNRPLVSADGRFVVFQSAASNLVADDTNGTDDCFRHDTLTGETLLVSRADDGALGNRLCYHPRVSSDGSMVAFTTASTNLLPLDANGTRFDSFIRHVAAGTTELIATHSDGTQGDGNTWTPTFSGDQLFLSMHSTAANLVDGDVNGQEDIFRRFLPDGSMQLVSVSQSGVQSDARSYVSRMDDSGRFVAFSSAATNLIDGETVTNGVMDVYVKDMQTGEVILISRAAGGGYGDGPSERAYISRDGTYVAFDSRASNLVSGDNNGFQDIFVRRFR